MNGGTSKTKIFYVLYKLSKKIYYIKFFDDKSLIIVGKLSINFGN